MNDQLLTQLRDWLQQPDGLPEPATTSLRARVHETRQERGAVRLLARFSMSGLLPASAAIVVLLVLGSVVLRPAPAAPPGPMAPAAAVATSLPASDTEAAASPSPAGTEVPAQVRHLRATVKGGWHVPDDGGCARMLTAGRDWMDCFLVDETGAVAGRVLIHAQDGDAEAGWGQMRIHSSTSMDGRHWEGPWLASESWPGVAARTPRNADTYGPLPRDLTIDSAWLRGSGEDGDMTLVLSIVDGELEGWLLPRQWSLLDDPALR